MTSPARLLTIFVFAVAVSPAGPGHAQSTGRDLVPFVVDGDRIPQPLGGLRGDAKRGLSVMLEPERGNCGICHTFPGGKARFQGDVGPPLAGVAARLDAGQIRLRVVDGTRINAATIMPPYYRLEGLNRVRAKFVGKPVLTAAEVEDVVAYLLTLKE